MDFWNVMFYAVIAVGVLLVGGVTYYRIDWARHPEKYQKDLEELEKEQEQKAKKMQAEEDAKQARKNMKKYQKKR